MKVTLAYGETGLDVTLPDDNLMKILKMKAAAPIANPSNMLAEMLEKPVGTSPLSRLAAGKKTACIVICDITRPVPNKDLLPPILTCLEKSGISRQNITILIATGIHRPNLGDELLCLVGEDIANNYQVVNHHAKEKSEQTHLGKTRRGTDVFVDTTYINSELKITTGFIEPHLMAGFSGGRKLICPGISSLETVKVMHGPKILEHPNAREGIIEGNPFHEEALEIAKMAGVDFIVNVALDEKKRINGIFAGDLELAHEMGVSHVREFVGDFVEEPADVVITTSAGYPLDATFYQAIKGLTAALPAVKKSGTIVLASECREGLGGPEFSQLVRETTDMSVFMENIMKDDYFIVDQWQFEELAKVMRKADVMVVSSGIPKADCERMLPACVESVEQALALCFKKYGLNMTVAAIPKGPYILCQSRR
ncbi:nickel-dependent lactate racemase [candidate division KSB1 bacterium]|nr:nickel-dependent lactate racemase [candidate division KSB1 bacterium]